MHWILLAFTLLILLLYFFYFKEIMKGTAQDFEEELTQQLAFLLAVQEYSKRNIWILYFVALGLEFYMLYLAFQVFSANSFMQLFTIMVACFKACHYAVFAFNLIRFFNDELTSCQIFNWPLERIAAMLLFTYCLVASAANIMMFLI